MNMRRFFILQTDYASWGFQFLGWNSEADGETHCLIGLSGDTGTGSVWIDILFIPIQIAKG